VIKIRTIKRPSDVAAGTGKRKKYIEGFGGEKSMKENTWKTTA